MATTTVVGELLTHAGTHVRVDHDTWSDYVLELDVDRVTAPDSLPLCWEHGEPIGHIRHLERNRNRTLWAVAEIDHPAWAEHLADDDGELFFSMSGEGPGTRSGIVRRSVEFRLGEVSLCRSLGAIVRPVEVARGPIFETRYSTRLAHNARSLVEDAHARRREPLAIVDRTPTPLAPTTSPRLPTRKPHRAGPLRTAASGRVVAFEGVSVDRSRRWGLPGAVEDLGA